MNKTILAAVAVIVILGIGAFAYKSMKQPGSTGSSSQTGMTKQTTAQTAEGTLKSLLAMGQSVQCTFSTTNEGAKSDGTVYVSNGKMRGDFKTVSDKMNVNNHMIVDGQYSYVWSDQSKQGMKMELKKEETSSPTGAPANGQQNGPNLNEKVNYTCKPWSANAEMFALPSGITFMTFAVPSAAPSGAATQEATTPAAGNCSICDQVPEGPGRDACKAQLHCQ